ncbi:uncharacterized protein LOC109841500 [Asparagus officinalis]|uniref:uncharacterized protein LOC109841473 n=1 Tax=Asparagus officinalis TaxID=4686 RepID=UPI00098E44EF|nr:uncharacterized protein LOC109841473 [Asparagus officinalis]XP_020266054.1 uncharacterized protein LOC109841500 [Asparagus officinalis]
MEGIKVLWDDLMAFKRNVSGPWPVGGDFNAILNSEEKLGGTQITDSEVEDFQNFIDTSQLKHIKSTGCFFTWSNKQDASTRVWSRLDKILVNEDWIFQYTSSQMDFLMPYCSDHSPGLLTVGDEGLITREKEHIRKYTKLLDCENSFHRQKANIKWGLQGHKSTQYFHAVMKNKRHHNRVLSIYTENGIRITDTQDIISEFIQYYKKLLGTIIPTTPPDPVVISKGPILSSNQRIELSKPVTREEIRQAVFTMSDGKAPGPDGFSASFFKAAWEVINEDIFMAVEEFF